MSMQVDIEVTCPKCNTKFNTKLYRTIWGENPVNRELVFSNSINLVQCKKCYCESFVPIPFMYVDVEKQFAVWYEPEYDPNIDRDQANYDKLYNPGNFYSTAPRIADWEEFKETIIKFENGILKAKPITQFKGLKAVYGKKSGCLSIVALFLISFIVITLIIF